MKRMFIVCATIAVMLCSCTKENFVTDEKVNTISATVPTETKTTIDGLHVTWSAGDAITAYNYSDPVSKYTLDRGEGTSNAEFYLTSGSGVNADNFRGFYPFTRDCYTSMIRYSTNIKQDGILDGEIPMYGDFVNKGDGTYNIQFKHTCGIVRFVFSGEASRVEGLNKITVNVGKVYKNAVTILTDGSLAYERGKGLTDSDRQIVVNVNPAFPVIGGKKTVDVIMTPGTYTDSSVPVWIYIDSASRNIAKAPGFNVVAGKITTINVNLDNIKDL